MCNNTCPHENSRGECTSGGYPLPCEVEEFFDEDEWAKAEGEEE